MFSLHEIFPWRDTILRRLLLLALLISLPLLGLFAWGFANRFHSDREHAATLLETSRLGATQQVQYYLKRLHLRLARLSAMPAVQRIEAPEIGQIFRLYLTLQPEFLHIGVMDRSGLIRYTAHLSPASAPPDLTAQANLPELRDATGFVVSSAKPQPASSGWSCVAALPVEGAPHLLLFAPIDLLALSQWLFPPAAEDGLVINVIDRHGIIVLTSTAAAQRIGRPLPAAPAIRQALQRGLDFGHLSDFDAQAQVYSARPLEGTDWLVIATVPTSEISRAAWTNLYHALGFIGLLLLAGTSVVVLYARSISRPIVQLAATARAQAGGQLDAIAPETGPLELAQTARAFNDMVAGRHQAEQSLFASERRYRELFMANPQPMWIYDLDTIAILEVNDATLRHYGYSREEFLALSLADIRPPEDRPAFYAIVQELRDNPIPEPSGVVILRHLKKNGEIIFVNVTSHPLNQPGRRARLALVDDITERRQAELALAESELRYRTVVDQTGQMVYDVDITTGTIRWFGGDAVLAILGYTLSEFPAVDVARLATLFHPEDAPRARHFFDEQMSSGEPYRLEYRLRHKDGSYRLVEDMGVFVRNASGRTVRSLGRLSDITQHREAERAVHELAAFQAAILDNATYALIATTPDGTIKFFNRAAERLLGYTSAECISRANALLIHDPAEVATRARQFAAEFSEPVPTGFETLVAHARRHQSREMEWTYVRQDGSRFPVLLSVAPLCGPEGEINGFIGIAADLTAHKRAEAERQQIEKKLLETQKLESLGVLAGGIAHDFNNLLTGILGNAGLARLELPSSSDALTRIAQIEKASHRAAELCKQMLAYSGKGRFVIQNLDLNELLDETTQLLHVSVSKRASLQFNLTRPLPAVQADATQLRQVVMNLVTNASEALGESNGRITLSTGVLHADAHYIATLSPHADLSPGDYVFLEVTDDGTGMDRATLSRIFDPFFTTKFTGRGLGLPAVLGIVRGHKGAIKVYSEPGRGTAFKVLLPLCPEPVQELRPPAPPAGQWRGTGHVLVVDDEEAVRQVAAMTLRVLGFTADTAVDGSEALELFQRNQQAYTLVLLDLTMPRLDGEETFRQLRQLNPDVKVILMSGFNKVDAINRFLGKGLAGFVQKPFAIETLTAELRRVLESPPPRA